MSADTGIGLVHGPRWGANFGVALMMLLNANPGSYLGNYLFFKYAGTGTIIDARNDVARSFLNSAAEYMLFLDDDIGFEPTLIAQLREAMTLTKAQMVTAVYTVNQRMTSDGLGGFNTHPGPAVYVRDGDGDLIPADSVSYSTERFHDVDACGAGMFLAHRSVYEEVAERYGDHWFSPTEKVRAEDLAFCEKVRACGIRIVADTWPRTSHLKEVWYHTGRHEGGNE